MTRPKLILYHKGLRVYRTSIRSSSSNYKSQITRYQDKPIILHIQQLENKIKIKLLLWHRRSELWPGTAKTWREPSVVTASVLPVEDIETIPKGPNPPKRIPPLDIDTINDKELKNYLGQTGHDKLSPRLFKQLKQQIFQEFTNIFDRSVQLSKVPEDWRMANVTPIFKSGNKIATLNNRPISLTSAAEKIREKIMKHSSSS